MLYRNEYLFISYENGTISVLLTEDWESINKLKVGKRVPVTDFAIHPSGRLAIAICRKLKEVSLYDLKESGKKISISKLQLEPISIKFSPKGTKYAILFQSGLEYKVSIYSLNDDTFQVTELTTKMKMSVMEFLSEDYLAIGEHPEMLSIHSLLDSSEITKAVTLSKYVFRFIIDLQVKIY